ncbi:helix-turn-helix transcriptional regulator [Paenibacillus sp. FSL H8-0034]|uniref:helix-turn-helix transcriptional regulator n=1 Tax=Paenibacillus sp. FSL H8-0034 TaxID=2954671 RepID=UPI0030F6F232
MSKKLQNAVTHILLTSLSIVLIGLIIFNLASDIIRKEIEQVQLISLQQTRDGFENYIKQLNQAAIQMEKVPDFEKWIDNPSAHKLNQFDRLAFTQLLVRVQASISYLDNVLLFDPEAKLHYSSQPTMDEVHSGYTSLLEEFMGMHVDHAFLTKDFNGSSTYVYIRKLPVFRGEPSSLLLFHVNSKLFYDYLGITNKDEANKATAFIMDGNGLPIGKGTFAGIEEITLSLAHDQELTALQSDQSHTLYKNGLLITCVSSSVTGWIFGVAVPDEQFLSKINSFRNITLLILLIAVALSILAVFISNHWFFRGWSKLIRLMDEPFGSKLTTKPSDEFERIYSHVSQLKHRLHEIIPEAKDAYLRKVLENGVSIKEDWVEKLDLQLHEEADYCGFAIEIDYYNQLKETYSEWDLFYFEYGIACVVREVLTDHGLAVKLNDGKLIGIAGSSEQEETPFREQLNGWMLTIHEFISEHFPITVTIGVSQSRKGTKYLHISASEAMEILKQKFSLGTNKVLYYEDLTSVKGLSFSFDESRRIEQDLIHSIRSRNMDEALLSLHKLRILAPEGDYHKLQHLLLDLTLSVYREIGAALTEPLEPPSLSELLRFTTMDEWLNWLQHHCAEYLIGRLTEEYHTQMKQAATHLRDYISEHILQDIRLEDCCKALGIPVSVAKQAIKELYETTYAELLLNQRIEKSKQWLVETDFSVDEIAKRLYYSNAQSFTRTFKKATGVPPGQYRKLYL